MTDYTDEDRAQADRAAWIEPRSFATGRPDPNATEGPLAQTATLLLGRSGAALVSIAIMVSTYGLISAELLSDARRRLAPLRTPK